VCRVSTQRGAHFTHQSPATCRATYLISCREIVPDLSASKARKAASRSSRDAATYRSGDGVRWEMDGSGKGQDSDRDNGTMGLIWIENAVPLVLGCSGR
jgi:hypothetical protein